MRRLAIPLALAAGYLLARATSPQRPSEPAQAPEAATSTPTLLDAPHTPILRALGDLQREFEPHLLVIQLTSGADGDCQIVTAGPSQDGQVWLLVEGLRAALRQADRFRAAAESSLPEIWRAPT